MHLAGPSGTDSAAVSQLDAAQAELEAGNAALLQGAPFLVEMLALQAAAPGMQPVSLLYGLVEAFSNLREFCLPTISLEWQDPSAMMPCHTALEQPFLCPH